MAYVIFTILMKILVLSWIFDALKSYKALFSEFKIWNAYDILAKLSWQVHMNFVYLIGAKRLKRIGVNAFLADMFHSEGMWNLIPHGFCFINLSLFGGKN